MAANFTPGLGDVRKEKQQQTNRGSHREMPFTLRQGREHKSHLPKSKVTPPCLSLTSLLSFHCCGVLKPSSLLLPSSPFNPNARNKGKNGSPEHSRHCGMLVQCKINNRV